MLDNGNQIWLGLDVSTSCVGVCLYEVTNDRYGKIHELTQRKLKSDKRIKGLEDLFLKGKEFERFIRNKYSGIQIDRVVIEEPLLTSNNAYTVETLIRFNTIVADSMYNLFGVVPDLISSYEARKYAFPELLSVRKINKQDKVYDSDTIAKAVKKSHICLFGDYKFDIDKKCVMMDCVNKIYDINWVPNKLGGIKKENYDSCDALVCVLGFSNKTKWGECKERITEYTTYEDRIDYTVSFGPELIKHTIYFR